MKREERRKERKQRKPAYRAMDCSSIAMRQRAVAKCYVISLFGCFERVRFLDHLSLKVVYPKDISEYSRQNGKLNPHSTAHAHPIPRK